VPNPYRTLLSATATAILAGLAAAPALAQDTESNDTPIGDHSGKDVPSVGQTPDYVIPDFPPRRPAPSGPDAPFFTLRPSLSLIGDWTGFSQDDENIAQMGDQENGAQIRSMRLTLAGSFGRNYRVSYQIAGEYKGFATDPATDWQMTDVNLTFPIGDHTKLMVGKSKESFSYEMVGDSANLPQSERVLNPFFISRNVGARITHVFGESRRATFAFGAYYDAWEFQTDTDRGMDVAARATALVWDDPDNNRFLHLGLAWRHVAVDENARYKGRPETNMGDNAVDTGDFAADSAEHFGGEALLNIGSVSFLGEYIVAKVDSPAHGDPTFQGFYVTGSWILTGETRPYDRNVGYARRVIPEGRWGAPELVWRYSRVDLDDQDLYGGSFDRVMVGLNWWATTRWKFGASYGHTWLDRAGLNGESDSFLTRIQWIY